jgi:hypothetical protein
MHRIILVAPPKLANATVQNTVVSSGVDLNEPQCGENGTGDFSWLLSYDSAASTLETGGAPPSADPFTTGWCFVNKSINGIQVGPSTTSTTTNADGSINSGTIPLLNIPIYYQSSIILLPISSAAIAGMKISEDHDCIGSVNVNALAADCSDNYQACSKWLTGGAITGFITLKAANQVQVALLSETLCSLLTGDKGGPPVAGATAGSMIATCTVDANGNPTAQGNYCSSPAAPGGCNDSYWLAATFAASAVNLDTANTNPDCQGGSSSTDAGGTTDSGGSTDASGE